ncbi:hypothetical protein BaRGS_00007042, partial [Batillaria attramentaria]
RTQCLERRSGRGNFSKLGVIYHCFCRTDWEQIRIRQHLTEPANTDLSPLRLSQLQLKLARIDCTYQHDERLQKKTPHWWPQKSVRKCRSSTEKWALEHWRTPSEKFPHKRDPQRTTSIQLHRMISSDHVRKIVQEEGRTARNLVQYSVPLEDESEPTGRPTGRQPLKTHRRSERNDSQSGSGSGSGKTPPPEHRQRQRSISELTKSPSSEHGPKKNSVDLRARYWKFLFDNFQRAVDGIYQTCEQDESVVECKEVIMMLEQSTKDFKSLIERLVMMKAFEDAAKDGDRPTSIAWEVRKMSPGKHASRSPDREEEEEGWETVQRGGRLRSRQSPSQKSMENLNEVGTSGKNLTRSLSVPDSSQQKNKRNFASTVSRGSAGDNKTMRAISEQHLPDTRERLDSKGSEKENIPAASPSEKSTNPWKDVSRIDNSVKSVQGTDSRQEQIKKVRRDIFDVAKEKRQMKEKEDADSTMSEEKETAVVKKEAKSPEEDSLDVHLNDQLAVVMAEEDALSTELEETQQEALASAIQEEETWLKALAQEQSSNIDIPTDTDSDLGNTMSSLEGSQPSMDWDALVAAHDAEQAARGGKSWGELVDEAEARTPGHGVHMHEKLSSPSRKRSPTESKRRHEEKQAKAQELREKLLQEKAERLRDLSKKVEEVRSLKEDLMRQARLTVEQKLQRAEEKRLLHLKETAQKAHEERAKANEIAFINTLEAQNKRHDIMSKHQESEARLEDIREERQRRHEEKQAKEAAVEERRRALEAERKAKLQDMQERRKQRDARIMQQQQEKEKERQEAMRAKEKDREERMAALSAQQQAQKEELQKKIQQKQDETTQRHEEHLRQIREKAFEMSVTRHSTEDHNDAPEPTPYDKNKLCIICNVLIPSEVYLLSHLRGKKHQQALQDNNSGSAMSKKEIETFNLKHIVDAPDNSTHPKIVTEKERQKSLKKRCKKLRQRMMSRGAEYESSLSNKQTVADSEHKAKLQKLVKDLTKYLQTQDSGPWPQNRVSALDRALGEMSRILEKKIAADQNNFRVLGGLGSVMRVLAAVEESSDTLPPVIPPKSLCLACDVYRLACKGSFDSCRYTLFSNKIGILVDHLIHRLTMMIPSERSPERGSGDHPMLPYDSVAASLMSVITTALSCLAKHSPTTNASEASLERMSATGDTMACRSNDIISYIISVGVIDKLKWYFSAVRGPVDGDKNAQEFLQSSLGLLVAMTKFMSKRPCPVGCCALCLAQAAPESFGTLTSKPGLVAKSRPGGSANPGIGDRISHGDSLPHRSTTHTHQTNCPALRGSPRRDRHQFTICLQSPKLSESNMRKLAVAIFGRREVVPARVYQMAAENSSIFDKKKLDDPSQLILTFEVTDLVGIVSLLYGMLLHSGAPSRGDSAPPELSAQTLAITISGLRMLNHMAVLDLSMLQRTLGEEGMSLEFRHIAGYLIWYSSHHLCEDLLHEVILCVGYFTVFHPDNQAPVENSCGPQGYFVSASFGLSGLVLCRGGVGIHEM